jgi:hypothetical protein
MEVRRLLLSLAVASALLAAPASAGVTEKSLSLDISLPSAGEQRFVDVEVRQRADGGIVQWLSVAAANSARLPADIRAGAAVTRPIVRNGVATMHVLVAINNLAGPGPAPATAREQPSSLDLLVNALGVRFAATHTVIGECAPWRQLSKTYRVWYYVKFEHRPASPREIFSNSVKDASASGRC